MVLKQKKEKEKAILRAERLNLSELEVKYAMFINTHIYLCLLIQHKSTIFKLFKFEQSSKIIIEPLKSK